MHTRLSLGLATITLIAAACTAGGDALTLTDLENESILAASIPGLSGKRITEERAGSNPGLTQLMNVSGSWEAASVNLAQAVQAHGWTVESINCVGTGNDVIATKLVKGQWVLLESGAGTRAAGIILGIHPNQNPPDGDPDIDNRCAAALINAVS